MEIFDVIVIGGGPSGSVASAYLHNQGKKVLVLEKEIFPRFVIGESLLPNCMGHLEEAGLLEVVKEGGFQVKKGAIFYDGDKRCCYDFADQFTEGWEWTWQVKREEFDKILIDEVQRRGVDVRFNCEVVNVEFEKDNQVVYYKNPNGESIAIGAKFVIDASGYGRVLPRLLDLNETSDLKARGAIFVHLQDSKRTNTEGNNIFIHPFNNNTAWLWAIPFSDGTTSVGIVGENNFIEDLGKNNASEFTNILSSFNGLNGRFENVEQLFEARSILGYSIGIKRMFGEGYVLCGNSTEFLDPVFSSGVTLATASGLLAAKLTNRQLDNEHVDWKTDYEDVMNEGIEVFRSYVNAWYDGDLQTIFFADDIRHDFKQQICSVLAGYVWDKNNPFIKKHNTILQTLAKVIKVKG